MTDFLIRQLIQPVEISNRHAHSEIVVRKHVKASERKNQEHLRGPNADAFDLNQRFNHVFICHAADAIQPQTAALNSLRQIQEITRFLGRDADASQLFGCKTRDTLR